MMKHANYARTRATKAKGGQTTFNSVGPDRATEFHKPIKPLQNDLPNKGVPRPNQKGVLTNRGT